jgi:hypothetical protein
MVALRARIERLERRAAALELLLLDSFLQSGKGAC